MSDTKSPYDDDVVDPYAGDDVKSPHEEAGAPAPDEADSSSDDDDEPAPRRKPGRPRKNPAPS